MSPPRPSPHRGVTTSRSIPTPEPPAAVAFYYQHTCYLLLGVTPPKATLDEKLQFAFALYDVNGNGRISADEMFDVFRLMSPRHLPISALYLPMSPD